MQRIDHRKDLSFDRRKQTDQIDSTPIPLEEYMKNYKPAGKILKLKFFVKLKKNFKIIIFITFLYLIGLI